LPAVSGHPQAIARRVLRANAERLGLDGLMRSLRLRRIIRSLGAWHVIFSQRHRHQFIHRAYVTVHMDSRRAVLIKNRAVPRRLLPAADGADIGVRRAREHALRSIRRRSDVVRTISHDRVWYQSGRGCTSRTGFTFTDRLRQRLDRLHRGEHGDVLSASTTWRKPPVERLCLFPILSSRWAGGSHC
jgi:hypothetical protein